MNKLTLQLGISKNNLREIYLDKDIYKAFKQDRRDFLPIVNQLVLYYSCFVNDHFVGAFMVINQSIYEKEIHSLLLNKCIKESRMFGSMIIEECFKDKNVIRLSAPVLSDLKKAQNYVKKLGFKHEGTKKNVTIRNGKILDCENFGLIRK